MWNVGKNQRAKGKHVIWIFISLTLGSLGQLMLKMASMGAKEETGLTAFYFALLKTPYVWLGGLSYGLSFLIWMKVLAEFDLSFARPFVGLSYILVALLAWFFLNEKITPARWAGILLITAGLVVLSFSRT